MMRMLEAGGMPVLIDGIRQADPDNPEGYYEYEPVKRLPKGDRDWVSACAGSALKVVSPLLEYLPNAYHYQVILMNRHIEEILASQRKMLARNNHSTGGMNDAELARVFRKQVQRTREWALSRPNVTMLEIDYNELLLDPYPSAQLVSAFLGRLLATDRMVDVVNPALYRNRASLPQQT
jgi:hypothetical protein